VFRGPGRGVLTQEQEGQDPLQHRRRLQPPRQRDVERGELHLHDPTPSRTATTADRGPPAPRKGGDGDPERAGTELRLGWEGAPPRRLGAANPVRPPALTPGSSCRALGALVGAPWRRLERAE
jgi:hypothetical protein